MLKVPRDHQPIRICLSRMPAADTQPQLQECSDMKACPADSQNPQQSAQPQADEAAFLP